MEASRLVVLAKPSFRSEASAPRHAMGRVRRRSRAALGVALLAATCATAVGRRGRGGRRGLEQTMSYPFCAMQRWTVAEDADVYFWNEVEQDRLREEERKRRNLGEIEWTGNMTETVLETLASAGETIKAPLDLLIEDFKQIQSEGLDFNPKQYWEEQIMPLLVESVGREGLDDIDESYYLYRDENDDEGWIMQFFKEGIAGMEENWKNADPEMFVHGRNALEGPTPSKSHDLEIVQKMKKASEQLKENWQKGLFDIGQDSPLFFNSVPGRGLAENEWSKIIGTTSPDNDWLSETKSALLDYLLPYQAEAEAWFNDPILEGWASDPLAPLLQHTMQLASEDILHNNNSMHAHDVLPDGTDLDWYVLLPEDPTERQEAVQEIAKELPAVLKNMGMRLGSAGLPAESLEAAGDKFLSMLQVLDSPGASKFESPPSNVNRNRRLLENRPPTLQSLFQTEPFSNFLEALDVILSEMEEEGVASAPEESEQTLLGTEDNENSNARKLLDTPSSQRQHIQTFIENLRAELRESSLDTESLLGEVPDFVAKITERVGEKLHDLGVENDSVTGRKLLGKDFKIYHALVSAAKALQPLDEADALNSDSMAQLARSFLGSFDLGVHSEIRQSRNEAPTPDLEEETISDGQNLMRRLLQVEEERQDGGDTARPSLASFLEDVLGTFGGILDDATAMLESISGAVAPAAEELDSFMEDIREDLISSGSRRLLQNEDQEAGHLQKVIERLKGARQTFSERLARGRSSKVSLEELSKMTKAELTRIISMANDALADAAAFLQNTLELDQSEAPEAEVTDLLEEEFDVVGRRKLLDLNDFLASTNMLDMALSGSFPFDGSMLDEIGKLTDLPIDGSIIKELERSGLVSPQQLEEGVHDIEELIAGAMKQTGQMDSAAQAAGLDETVVEAISSMIGSAPAPESETVEDAVEDDVEDTEASAAPPLNGANLRASISPSSAARAPFATASLQKKSNLLDRIITAIGMDRVKDFVQGCRSLKLSCAPQLNRIEGEIEQFGDVLNPLLTTFETWSFLQSQAQALAERMNEDGLMPEQGDLSRISEDIQEGRIPGFPSINLAQVVKDRVARWQDTLESIMKSRTEPRRPVLDLVQGFFAETPEESDISEIHSLGADSNSTGLGTILEVMSSLSNAQKTIQKIAQAPTFFVNGALSDQDEQALHRSAPWLSGPDWDSHTKILGRANSFGYFFGFLDGYKVRDHPAVATIVLAKKIYAHLKTSIDELSSEDVLKEDKDKGWDGLLKLRFAAEDLASKFFKPLQEPPEWMKILGRPSWEINNEIKKLVESNAYLQGWVEGFMFRDDPAVDLVVTAIKIAKRKVFMYSDDSWDNDIRIDFGKVKFGKHSAGMAEAPSVKEMLEALKFRLEQRPLLKRSGIAFPSEILEAFDIPPSAEDVDE